MPLGVLLLTAINLATDLQEDGQVRRLSKHALGSLLCNLFILLLIGGDWLEKWISCIRRIYKIKMGIVGNHVYFLGDTNFWLRSVLEIACNNC